MRPTIEQIRYEQVDVPDLIIFISSGGKEDDGAHTHRTIVEFREKGAKTEVAMRMIFPSATERDFRSGYNSGA
jgi:hypothetical protein